MGGASVIDIYWVVLCKDGPLYAVAGPFCTWETAEDAFDALEAPSGRCSLKIMKQKIEVEEL